MPRQSVTAMHGYLDYKLNGPGEGRETRQDGNQKIARERFAKLINAQPAEIAFVQSTLMGENIVVDGLGIPGGGYEGGGGASGGGAASGPGADGRPSGGACAAALSSQNQPSGQSPAA